MSQAPNPSQPPALDAVTFCTTTVDIVRGHIPTIVGNLTATDALVADAPTAARDRLRPHVAALVDTGQMLGRRLLRAVDLALAALASGGSDVRSPGVSALQDELLGLADELGELLLRLSLVEVPSGSAE